MGLWLDRAEVGVEGAAVMRCSKLERGAQRVMELINLHHCQHLKQRG